MSLKARVLAALALVLVLISLLGFVVVASQRSELENQLDSRLRAAAPLQRPGSQPGRGPAPPVQTPVSELYVAEVAADGTTTVRVVGQLLSDTPDLGATDVASISVPTFVNLSAANGSMNFRVLLTPAPNGTTTSIVGLPTADIDDTISGLTATFAVAVGVIALMLGAVGWWVIRLGVKPLTDMTNTALAIANGETEERAPVTAPGTEAGQLATALNVMLDERDEADARLRAFVADASHELRSPLTSITGYLDLYAAGGFREPGQLDDAVRRMRAESARMTSLVEDLLRLARLDEENPLELGEVDIGLLLEDLAADARVARPDRNITVDAPDRGALVVVADGNRLRQLVAGLVNNALVHAPDADVTVSAHPDADSLVLAVTDNGPGLEPELAARVFDRFYRGDKARARARGGSGLGLAIANAVAKAHNGTIQLETSVGGGCTFTVRIPLVQSNST